MLFPHVTVHLADRVSPQQFDTKAAALIVAIASDC
jgi:hypothetical protein